MGIFNKVFNKPGSMPTAPHSIPSPPTDEELEIPPLPPEKAMELPDLTPEPGSIPVQQPPPPIQTPPPEPEPPVDPGPHIPTAEENRIVDEYENTDLQPTEQKLPLGAPTSPHFPEAESAIGTKPEGPLFVTVDDFRIFIDGQNRVKINIKEADNIITRLNEIKIEEDKQFEKWRTNLEEINKKIGVVDKKVFESK